MLDTGEEGVWGEEKGGKKAGGKERGGRGEEERSGVQETTGMCRMAGGWPRERTEREKVGLWSQGTASYGETEEDGNTLTCVGGTTSVLLKESLGEISARTE